MIINLDDLPHESCLIALPKNLYGARLRCCPDLTLWIQHIAMSYLSVVSFDSFPRVLLLVPLILVLYALGLGVYRLTLHPYAKYPGPVFAKARRLAHIKGVS